MKQLTQEPLGPMFHFGTATLYVYDSSDEDSMTALLDFLHHENANWKIDYRTLCGFQGYDPCIENGRRFGSYENKFHIFINLAASENSDLLNDVLPHELTHLVFCLSKYLRLPLDKSEPAAMILGNLNKKWRPLVKNEIEAWKLNKMQNNNL